MALVRRSVDLSVIALWLGHESTETTQIYLHADMQLKEHALHRVSLITASAVWRRAHPMCRTAAKPDYAEPRGLGDSTLLSRGHIDTEPA